MGFNPIEAARPGHALGQREGRRRPADRRHHTHDFSISPLRLGAITTAPSTHGRPSVDTMADAAKLGCVPASVSYVSACVCLRKQRAAHVNACMECYRKIFIGGLSYETTDGRKPMSMHAQCLCGAREMLTLSGCVCRETPLVFWRIWVRDRCGRDEGPNLEAIARLWLYHVCRPCVRGPSARPAQPHSRQSQGECASLGEPAEGTNEHALTRCACVRSDDATRWKPSAQCPGPKARAKASAAAPAEAT